MAEDNDLDLGEEKKSSKLLYMIIGGVVALLIIVGATLYFMGFFSSDEDGEDAEVAEDEQESVVKGDPVYQPLGADFVVRFKKGEGARLLQISISTLTYDAEVVEAVKKHTPMIRNNLLLLLSSKKPIELKTPEGKESLRQEILESVQKVIEDQLGKKGVEQVFFTAFVMQ